MGTRRQVGSADACSCGAAAAPGRLGHASPCLLVGLRGNGTLSTQPLPPAASCLPPLLPCWRSGVAEAGRPVEGLGLGERLGQLGRTARDWVESAGAGLQGPGGRQAGGAGGMVS